MNAFDKKEIDGNKQEAKARWGETAAYAQYTENVAGKNERDLFAGMEAVLAEFSACKTQGNVPSSPAAQELVEKLQNYISNHIYTSTKEILAGLGQMYTADERFKTNIDKHGEGTASFISSAIAHYCA